MLDAPQKFAAASLWGLLYAVATVGIRAVVVEMDPNLGSEVLRRLGAVAATPAYWGVGLAFGWVFVSLWKGWGRLLAALLVVVAVGGHLAALQFERAFHRLPDQGVLRFASDNAGLDASIHHHLPETSILGAWGVVAIGLVAAIPWLRDFAGSLGRGQGRLFHLGGLLGVLGLLGNTVFPPSDPVVYAASREPFVHFLMPERDRKVVGDPLPAGTVLAEMGVANPDDDAPFCTGVLDATAPSGRSVTLLLIEAMGTPELFGEHQQVPIMPRLRALADQHPWVHGVAPGNKSAQAFSALFAGLPPQLDTTLLHHADAVQLGGFAGDLGQAGVRTGFFHGGDLSFENQALFLEKVGFDYIFELGPHPVAPVTGWGYDDRTVLTALQEWLSQEDGPTWSAMASLSSHDPYTLPPGHQPVFAPDGLRYTAFAETLRYTDDAVSDFVTWWQGHRTEGDVLVITGDHGPRVARPDQSALTRTGEIEYDFDVPVLFLGLRDHERLAPGLASLQDVGATIAEILGGQAPCGVGHSLLGSRPTGFPIVSVAPDHRRFVYLRDGNLEWMLDRATDQLALHDRIQDPTLGRNLGPGHPLAGQVRGFLAGYQGLLEWAVQNNGFWARRATAPPRPPLPEVEQVMFVSHRGNTRGPSEHENTLEAVSQAVTAGFDWVEIDLQLTRDQQVVVLHDNILEDGTGVNQLRFEDLRGRHPETPTLDQVLASFPETRFLLEIKPQRQALAQLLLADAVARRVEQEPHRFLVDSFVPWVVARLTRYTEAPVGLDQAPGAGFDAALVSRGLSLGADWLYLHRNEATPDNIKQARADGLRVMVYGVDAIDHWQAIEGTPPDGVITDFDAVRHAGVK